MEVEKLNKQNSNDKIKLINSTGDKVVKIDKKEMEYLLKDRFGWRAPTKNYSTLIERYDDLKPHVKDYFIGYLIEKNYAKNITLS